jgi:hypothetical protein
MASYFKYLDDWLKKDKEAQLEAVKRLGLPANNTAADRAKAMGFSDKTYYHGTNTSFDEFDLTKSANDKFGGDWGARAVFVAPNAEMANRWSRIPDEDITELYKGGNETTKINGLTLDKFLSNHYFNNQSQVLPVKIRDNNLFDYTNPEHIKKMQKLLPDDATGFRLDRLKQGNWKDIETKDVQTSIKNNLFDGFHVKENMQEDITKGIGMFSPSGIRSPLAHFNPKYLGVGGSASGAILSADLMADELDLEYKPKPSMFKGLMDSIGNANQQQAQAYGDTGVNVASGVGSLLADPSMAAELAVRGVAGLGLGGLLMSNDVGSAEDPRFLERLR